MDPLSLLKSPEKLKWNKFESLPENVEVIIFRKKDLFSKTTVSKGKKIQETIFWDEMAYESLTKEDIIGWLTEKELTEQLIHIMHVSH